MFRIRNTAFTFERQYLYLQLKLTVLNCKLSIHTGIIILISSRYCLSVDYSKPLVCLVPYGTVLLQKEVKNEQSREKYLNVQKEKSVSRNLNSKVSVYIELIWGLGGYLIFKAASVVLAGLRIRFRIIFGSWIRIRIRVKSWIRIRSKVEIQKLLRLRLEQWRVIDAQNGGLKGAQNGALYCIIQNNLKSILTNNELPRSEYRRRNSRPYCSPPGTGSAAPDAGPHTVQPSPGQNLIRFSFFSYFFWRCDFWGMVGME